MANVFAAATRSFSTNASRIARSTGDMAQGLAHGSENAFRKVASYTSGKFAHLDQVVTEHGGLREAYGHAFKTRPVTTLAVTGGVVAGTGVLGGHALSAMMGRGEERDRGGHDR